jgi:RNA polymerase sigma-70 factor (ECF subfamily)
MKNQEIYHNYNSEIYFFLLKKVKEEHIAKDILQSTFLKAYENFHQIKDKNKIKAWLFRIARNEIMNYYNQESAYVSYFQNNVKQNIENNAHFCCSEKFCCFDNFINELPEIYKEVIKLIYTKGKKQKETAVILNINLPTVKARIRRAKSILKKRFTECCHYEVDKNGRLLGEPNCVKCNTVLKG